MDQDMDAMLLLLVAIVEEAGGQVSVSERARVAAQSKGLETYVEVDGTLVLRLLSEEDIEQMELDLNE